jgi:zinc protease
MRTPHVVLKALTGVILLATAYAQQPQNPGAASQQAPATPPPSVTDIPQLHFSQILLKNRMPLILSEDRAVPVVTESMIFNVGGRNEHPGRSGFAHLFEHLMFEGSLHAPKGVFDHMVEGYGGNDNASTHEDYTIFYEDAPSNVLPMLMWLDADRLANLDVTPANMKNQISVVEEEKRMRVDNQPYGQMDIVTRATAFRNWQNAHPVIGSFKDLDAATLQDVKKFFDDYYAPKNGILAIVGDINRGDVEREAESYFDQIPNRGTPVPVNTVEPPQTAERHAVIHDPHANVPALEIAWHGPERNTPDFYALGVMGELLFSGKSSRLYESLVKERQVALDVEGGIGFPEADVTDYKSPGLFAGDVVYKPNADAQLIEELIFREIHEIVANGVTDDELNRVKTKIKAEWIEGEQTTLDRSQLLLTAALLDGDPNTANTELYRLLSVRSDDIVAAAQHYLTHPNTTVVVDLPGPPPATAGSKAKPAARGAQGSAPAPPPAAAAPTVAAPTKPAAL